MAGVGCRPLLGSLEVLEVGEVPRSSVGTWHDLEELQVIRRRSGASQMLVCLHRNQIREFGSSLCFFLSSGDVALSVARGSLCGFVESRWRWRGAVKELLCSCGEEKMALLCMENLGFLS